MSAALSQSPTDWLYTNPQGSNPDFVFGVLRKEYRGRVNSVVEFAMRKLRPVVGRAADGSPDPTAITAYGHDVVLPPDAPDTRVKMATLLTELEAGYLPQEPAILIYLTLSFPAATRHHLCFEAARAFAHQVLARERRLPVLLVQHAPNMSGSTYPPHVHLLIGPRRVGTLGLLAEYDRELVHDKGQAVLHDAWTKFLATWAG